MHEASLAEGIIKIALDAAKENHAAKISEVGVVIGEMSGVEVESLEFSFRLLTKGTAAESARLVVQRTSLVARCGECGNEIHLTEYNFFCPRCGGVLEIISGREMQVRYVEAD